MSGEIAPEDLYTCSMHDHVFVDGSVYVELEGRYRPDDYPHDLDADLSIENIGWIVRDPFLFRKNALLDDLDIAANELRAFADAGGSALLDVTSLGIRLSPELLREASRRSGVHIIASTGLYIEESWPSGLRGASEDQLLDFLLREIEHGIANTGVLPGHIGELGITTLSEAQKRLLRAAAGASNATGLAMSVHVGSPEFGASGLDVARTLLDAGADPSRVIMSHAEFSLFAFEIPTLISRAEGGCMNGSYATQLLDLGFTLSIDTFGHNWQTNARLLAGISDWQRLVAVQTLVHAGYGRQLVMGTDVCMKILCEKWGGRGYRYLLDFVVPGLERLGVSRGDTEMMLIDNPRRILDVSA